MGLPDPFTGDSSHLGGTVGVFGKIDSVLPANSKHMYI